MKKNNHREVHLIAGTSTFGKSNFANAEAYNYNRVVIVDPLAEYDGKYFRSLAGIEKHITGNPIYRIKTDNLRQFDELCALLMVNADPDNRIMLVIEEMTRLDDLDAPKLKKTPHFRNIVYGGGHEGIDLIAVAQNFATFPRALRSQWQTITIFRQTDEPDLKRLQRFCSREIVQQLPNLAKREYFRITNQKTERGRS